MEIRKAEIETPIGRLTAFVGEQGLCRLAFEDDEEVEAGLERRFGPLTLKARRNPGDVAARLRAFFGGDLEALDAIEVDTGGTDFQRKVWRALRRVPVGRVISYGELARRVGRPSAVRAVGLANGANPVPIVIPCHRVIGADGRLTGYGGGLDRKAWLLRHEGATFREEAGALGQAALFS